MFSASMPGTATAVGPAPSLGYQSRARIRENGSQQNLPSCHPPVSAPLSPSTRDSTHAQGTELAVNGLHTCRHIPLAHNLISRNRCLEFRHFGRSQVDVRSSGVLLQICPAFGSWDWNDIITLGQYPCEGQLSGLYAATI